MKYLYLVWSNLKRKKLRTVLTVLSILVAFLLFGYLAAIRTAFTQGIEVAGLDRLVVRHKVSIIQMLPASYEARIEQVEGVEEAVAAVWFGGYFQEPRNQFPQFPVKPGEYMEMFPEFLLGEDEHGDKVKHYYPTESTGLATGVLITALHEAGLATLTHTPSPMKFLNEILGRPKTERPFLLLVVGYPAADCEVPDITRKSLDAIATFIEG